MTDRHADKVATIAEALGRDTAPSETVSIWCWRYRSEIHGMKWIREFIVMRETADEMLRLARHREPSRIFVASEGMPAVKPVWRPSGRWALP